MALNGIEFSGYWNADTNRVVGKVNVRLYDTPRQKVQLYLVLVGGATQLGAVTEWVVGDFAYYNGFEWSKLLGSGALDGTIKAAFVLDSTSLHGQLRPGSADPIDLSPFVNSRFDGQSTPVDNSDVLSEVLTKAGRKMYLPTGRAFVEKPIAQVKDKSVVLHGFGRESELVFDSDAGGILVDQANFTMRTDFYGLSLTTAGKEAGPFAIDVKYSDADAVINVNQSRARVSLCTFDGLAHEAQGWSGAIRLHNANGAIIEDIYSYGRKGTLAEMNAAEAAAGPDPKARARARLAAELFNQKNGIVLSVGDTYGLGIFALRNINLFNLDTPIQVFGVRSVEGIQGDLFNLVGCRIGVDCIQGADSPGLRLTGGHINASEMGIRTSHMPETFISQFLIYKIPQSVEDMQCVVMSNMPSGFFNINFIGKNQTSGADSTGKFIGLALNDAPYGHIDFDLERGNIGVVNTGVTTEVTGSCRMHGTSGSNPKFIVDTSAGNNFISRKAFARDITNLTQVNTNTAGTFPLSTSWEVLAGERYTAKVIVGHNNNGATGDVIASLTTSGGSATISFPTGLASQGGRLPQASGTVSTVAFTVEFTIQTSGTLALAVLVQALGGAGFVATQASSMTIRNA